MQKLLLIVLPILPGLLLAMAILAILVVLAWRWRMRVLLAQNRRLDVTVRHRTAELRRKKGELERARAELFVQATFDQLTGLLNRRAVLEQLQALLADETRRRRGLAVALVDLDHFKRVNDIYGHQAGDTVLRTVAMRLANHLRSVDLLGRYGGEELLMVMEDIDAQDALQRLEALRVEVGIATHEWERGRFTVTLSVGMAWVGAEHVSMHDLVLRADRALYAAKQGGRNRVVAAGPSG